MAKCECPSCYYEFDLDEDTIVGEIVTCSDCGVDLEVTKIENGIATVEVAEQTEEDWGE
ncbi:MAG: lysine biosynthesis protein LysW [Candidatus Lokiarchaeota archaeon]|nr:lysine biosynthesis protein LysW [Candidatus Lokiarchaeota archaeon]